MQSKRRSIRWYWVGLRRGVRWVQALLFQAQAMVGEVHTMWRQVHTMVGEVHA